MLLLGKRSTYAAQVRHSPSSLGSALFIFFMRDPGWWAVAAWCTLTVKTTARATPHSSSLSDIASCGVWREARARGLPCICVWKHAR